jgi:hypothetical protein
MTHNELARLVLDVLCDSDGVEEHELVGTITVRAYQPYDGADDLIDYVDLAHILNQLVQTDQLLRIRHSFRGRTSTYYQVLS